MSIKSEKNKKMLFYMAAFALPALIMLLIYIAIEVYPVGDNSVLVLDLNGQYVYFYEGLRDIVLDGAKNLSYTWSRAMGGEFMGIFAYYVASPLSLITVLFPKGMITEALLTMFLLKTGLCGLTMSCYLRRRFSSPDHIKILIVSTLYALSSYAVVMQHNNMWMDCLVWLPLLVMGIEELVSYGRFKLFIISLAMSVISNFYIGYMMCIFVFIYFFYYYISRDNGIDNNIIREKKHFIKSLARIGASSVIAVAMSAWVVYPAYYSLTFGKTTFSDPSYVFEQKFEFFDLIVKLFPGSYDTVRPEGLPFVYCGVLVLILLPLYFIGKNVSTREKVMGGILVTIFILSFNMSTFDLFWHGMQRPNWLNYRYSFMLIFVMLVFAYRVLQKIEKIDFKQIYAVCAVLGLLVLIISKHNYKFLGEFTFTWYSLLAIGVIMLTLHSIRYGYFEKGGVLILLIVICVETFCSGLLNVRALDGDVSYSSRSSYVDFINRLTPIVDRVQNLDDSFYRMEKSVHRKTNDNFALGMYGLSGSTSTLNASQIDLLNRLGYSSKSHWSKYLGGTVVSDSLLGVKYVVYDKLNPNDYYSYMFDDPDNSLYAYCNPYALSIAYSVNPAIKDIDASAYDTPFELMNAIVGAMLGYDEPVELFRQVPISEFKTENMVSSYVGDFKKYVPADEDEDSKITFFAKMPEAVGTDEIVDDGTNTDAGVMPGLSSSGTQDVLNPDSGSDKETSLNGETVYLFIPSEYPRECDLSVNNISYGTYFGNETDRIVEVGKYSSGDSLKLTLKMNEDNLYIKSDCEQYLYYIDEQLLLEVLPQLQKGSADITDYTSSSLSGTVNIQPGQTTLFTTIMYDKGWSVKVDGEKTPIYETLDSLIAVDIAEGEHKIEFEYAPECISTGNIISILGVIAFAAVCAADYYSKKRQKQMYLEIYQSDFSAK